MADENEESISVTIEDCKRWSSEINERLEDIRAKDGEDTYKLMFMAAFLLLWFAQSVDADDDDALKVSKPAPGDLN